MRARIISVVVIVAGFAAATMVVAQPTPPAKLFATEKPESELARLRAEIELLQLEHDVDAARLRKLLTDEQTFDDAAAIANALYEVAKREVAEMKQAAKLDEDPTSTPIAVNLSVRFESLGGFEVTQDGVKLIRPVVGRKKNEFLRKSIELNEKRIELAKIENKSSAAK